jgi:nucleoside-diphosphate-sugar epimerase
VSRASVSLRRLLGHRTPAAPQGRARLMRAIVTGAAGFVGSHLCESLLMRGDEVVGVDSFTDFYDRRHKEANAAILCTWDRFVLRRSDLLIDPLEPIFDGADVVFHLAGQPGVRPSWGQEFATYVDRNVGLTQRLLEAVRHVSLRLFVYASSSSVYGDAEAYPTTESICPRPVSPYGVTKLAAEHLCELYRTAFAVPTASLRLFTVYGPRQRPDVAFSRLVSSVLSGYPFTLYGDGEQTRDFTFVDDVVDAMLRVANAEWTGVANVGGGVRTSMKEVVRVIEGLAGPIRIVHAPAQRGDVRHTAADTTLARESFGYEPRVSLADGLTRMLAAAGYTPHRRSAS